MVRTRHRSPGGRRRANDPAATPRRRTPGRLTVHEADLLRPGSFDEATRGCQYVFHVASPFLVPEQITDASRQVVAPAVEGTRNVLAAVARAGSVKRGSS